MVAPTVSSFEMTAVKPLNKIKRQHTVMGQRVAQFEADMTRQTLGNVQDFERLKVPTPAFCEHEFRHDQVNFVMKKKQPILSNSTGRYQEV